MRSVRPSVSHAGTGQRSRMTTGSDRNGLDLEEFTSSIYP